MTDVKLFYENAPFQVKGLHIARGDKEKATPFTFLSVKGEKKRKSWNTDLYYTQTQRIQGGKI